MCCQTAALKEGYSKKQIQRSVRLRCGFIECLACRPSPIEWIAETPKPSANADPKAAIGITKPQLHLIPPAANDEMAKALQCGATKYGTRNWMQSKVAMTVYLAAMKRHIDCLLDGEDVDLESGAHHLGHVMAGCGIVLDALRHGMLIDDRVLPPKKP